MRIQLLVLCLGLFCLGSLIPVHAIYQEQAEQHSWYQQHLGKVNKAMYAYKGRDRVFVSTEQSVIASLDLRDGKIIWRQVLLPDDTVEAIALTPKPAAVVSLSKRGQTLRAWHAGDGVLLWESPLMAEVGDTTAGASPGQLVVLADVTGDGSADIAVLGGKKLQVLPLSLHKACRHTVHHPWPPRIRKTCF